MARETYDHAERFCPEADRQAVDDLNLEIGDGECMVLFGPSGCGKKDRDIAMVFQNCAPYPHILPDPEHVHVFDTASGARLSA